jgi:hypothetical protein
MYPSISDFLAAGWVTDEDGRGRETVLLKKTVKLFASEAWGGLDGYNLMARFFQHPGGRAWLEVTGQFRVEGSNSLVEVLRNYLDDETLAGVEVIETFFMTLYSHMPGSTPLRGSVPIGGQKP